MRLAPIVTISAVGLALACSSADEPPCEIAGLYTATGALESGDCPLPTDAVADTFTVNGDEATLTVQGVAGSVTGKVSACKWTASAEIKVLDALDPKNATGTTQYSWTFTKTGFSGTSAVSVPPAKSLPNGCRGIAKITGTKR